MTDRRGGRPSQVRPRPPSNGRPAPAPARPRKPAPGRRQPIRPVERRQGLPLASKLMVAAAVVGVAFALYLTATGGLGRMATAFGATIDGMVDSITATPTPQPTVVLVADAPELAKPLEPYINQRQVDVQVTLPPGVAGSPGTVRLRLGLPEAATPPVVVQEVPVGPDGTMVIPGVPLEIGRNDFTATIANSAGESESSPVVTYVLDLAKPPLEVFRPADGEEINADRITISGKSQGRAAIVARNGRNGATVTVQASTEGTFEVELPLGSGVGMNKIGITATDPAGNIEKKLFDVIRGDGKLTAVLTAEPAGVSVASLPQPMKLSVLVTDPDDKPLEGAAVTFTLSVPSIQVVTAEAVTGADGIAVFETTVPNGATAGDAIAAILVTTEEHGETTEALEFRISN